MRRLVPFFLLLLPFPLAAQTPYLVKDINPVSMNSPGSSNPYGFIRFGSNIFCGATDNSTTFRTGTELWAIGAGTQFADINSGADSSNPSRFTVVNGKLLFNANDGQFFGEELWGVDGTNNVGRIADIYKGPPSSAPGDRIVYHDRMLFSADDGVHGRELWITDGTSAGTRLLKDLIPGVNGSDPRSFVVFNDVVYFGAADGGFWRSDGTESGTVNVAPSIAVSEVVVAGSRMFFSANTGPTGIEPWVSDGTEAGTHMIAEIAPGSANSISGLTPFGERILFVGIDEQHGAELWISDGTAGGTHIVRDINPGPAGTVTVPLTIAVAGNVAFFAAAATTEGAELWKTDGTEGGTTIVRDILTGSEGSAPAGIVAVGGKVFFVASNGVDRTLWITDGTNAGTRQVKTSQRLAVGTSRLNSALLTNIDGVVYFSGAAAESGYEPWKSDGTDGGTSFFANLAGDSEPSSGPSNFTAAGNWLFFSAFDGQIPDNGIGLARSIFRTDGTAEGTVRLTDTALGSNFTAAGNLLFFRKENGDLWMSDGTPEGTVAATSFVKRFPRPPFVSSPPFINFVLGDKLFVSYFDSPLSVTTMAPDAPVIPLGIKGSGFSEVAGRAMFFSGKGLWISDGTLDGTNAVVPDLVQTVISGQAVMGGRLYFAKITTDGMSLWRSDGTFEGTTEVKAFTKPIGSLTSAGRNLFFTVDAVSPQLWVTDGTPTGTHSLPAAPVTSITAVGERVIFVSTDFAVGREPWVSDGTAEGTRVLRDVNVGTNGSFPSELAGIAGLGYFTASDIAHGNEPWVTDGTAAGTRLAGDVETATYPTNPGSPGSSDAHTYVRAGDRIYFAATTQATGNELWAIPLPSTPRLTINDVRVAEGDAGTATAHFTVTLSSPSTQTITVDYATADDTAVSGSDYDSASGTLTFAAGQTSKSIDIPVHGDAEPENNEVFFVTLRNPAGATIEKSSAFAIIDDDDQNADVSLALDFSQLPFSFGTAVSATNNGPRTATNMRVSRTSTPGDSLTPGSSPTTALAFSLAPGATAQRVATYSGSGAQQYLTATITERQRDPQPSNNSIGWTVHDSIAMEALYLNPGSEAKVWLYGFGELAGVQLGVESSNPAVLSVPSSVTMPASNLVSFVARGLSLGTSTIRISTTTAVKTLTVDVLPAGTKPRWPGAIYTFPTLLGVPLDVPLVFPISPTGTAPYTGERATGTVTLTSKGHELARVTLVPNMTQEPTLTYYPEQRGSNPIAITYTGDTNFLPITMNVNVEVSIGSVTMLAGAARAGTTATVHIRVTGSPLVTPTGTITLGESVTILGTPATLVTTSPGVAEAEIKLTNVAAGTHTYTLAYSGDTNYAVNNQAVRLVEAHTRAVRH